MRRRACRILRQVLLLILSLLLPLSLRADPPLRIIDPWMREAPPRSQVAAGYVTLENPGPADRILTGAASPAFARVEMHQTIQHNGMARMAGLGELPIPVGGRVIFTPGGNHLMLIAPQGDRPLRAGQQVPLVLKFADGGSQALDLLVKGLPDSVRTAE
ncbi:MAG: copper chaperone PCu(A)C [Magnetococcales bacterium]|nr:copper chaperone PCu(A)C [Magnetococcales bacterium]